MRVYQFVKAVGFWCRAANNRQLLLQKAAVLLGAVIPAARLLAHRITHAAIGHADRHGRLIRILFAVDDANALLTATSHRGGSDGLDVEQCDSQEGDRARCDFMSSGVRQMRITASFHADGLGTTPPNGNNSYLRSVRYNDAAFQRRVIVKIDHVVIDEADTARRGRLCNRG